MQSCSNREVRYQDVSSAVRGLSLNETLPDKCITNSLRSNFDRLRNLRMDQHENSHSPAFFVDDTPYSWAQPTITGAQIRQVAAIPANVDLFLKVPGHPDDLIADDTIVKLGNPKPHLSTQAVGSKGG